MAAFTVAIMAGGASSRMGTDKSFVPLLGRPMIEHVLAKTARLGQAETILITNRPGDYAYLELPVFQDVIPGQGALGGIYTALCHSRSDSVLVVACDMPFLNPDLLLYMITRQEEDGGPYDIVVPRVADHPQGLHALYRRACRGPIREKIDASQLKIIGFYSQVRVRYLEPPEWSRVDPQGWSFQNINTPDELRAAQKRVVQRRVGSDQPPGDRA